MESRWFRRRAAFTLTELAVVMGLISALASVVTLTAAKARRESQAVTCLSNLRQIGTALVMHQEKYGAVPGTKQAGIVSLPDTLGEFITEPDVFVCPASAGQTSDSYSAFYVPRPPVDGDGFLIGCPRHGEDDATVGLFGGALATRTASAPVLWNGAKVLPGDTVAGGTLKFADGTEVTIAAGLNVIVVASFQEGEGKIYSAVRIPNGAFGAIDVRAAHGTHFDVATPACTAGVRGTRFTVTTSLAGAAYKTTIAVSEGTVAVDSHWPTAQFSTLHGFTNDSRVYSVPIGDFAISTPTFSGKDVTYSLNNVKGQLWATSEIHALWPLANGALKQIRLNGVPIYNTITNPPAEATINGNWLGTLVTRCFNVNQTKTLTLTFEQNVSTDAAGYLLTMTGVSPLPPQNGG